MCLSVLPACTYMYYVCGWSTEVRVGVRSPETWKKLVSSYVSAKAKSGSSARATSAVSWWAISPPLKLILYKVSSLPSFDLCTQHAAHLEGWEQFSGANSPSASWDLGIKFRSLNLMVSIFTWCTILLACKWTPTRSDLSLLRCEGAQCLIATCILFSQCLHPYVSKTFFFLFVRIAF